MRERRDERKTEEERERDMGAGKEVGSGDSRFVGNSSDFIGQHRQFTVPSARIAGFPARRFLVLQLQAPRCVSTTL